MIWRYINDWMILKKKNDWTPTGRFVYIFQTLILSWMAVKLDTISLMIGHAPDAAMLAWLSGQVEVGFSYIREFYIGKCLFTSQMEVRRNTSQIIMENIIQVTTVVACTYRQSQFCIELSCSSALSKRFPDFHWVNGSLNFEWPLPSHETG